MYNFTSSKACYTVNLKFTHDVKHPQGNHYDASTKIPALTNQVLADVSNFYGWQYTKKEKSDTIPSSTTVIDLTDDNDGLIYPDKNQLHRSNSTADSLFGGTTDVYSFSDETYMSSEAECFGTGQYCIRSTPRSLLDLHQPLPLRLTVTQHTPLLRHHSPPQLQQLSLHMSQST